MSIICIGIAQYSRMSLKKPQFEVNIKNKMCPVDVKALPIIAFALTGRIVLLGFILFIFSHFDYSIRWFVL